MPCSRYRIMLLLVPAMSVLLAEAKGVLAILTGNRDLWSDACALWVQVRAAVNTCASSCSSVQEHKVKASISMTTQTHSHTRGGLCVPAPGVLTWRVP
jgi:hypothetical protein